MNQQFLKDLFGDTHKAFEAPYPYLDNNLWSENNIFVDRERISRNILTENKKDINGFKIPVSKSSYKAYRAEKVIEKIEEKQVQKEFCKRMRNEGKDDDEIIKALLKKFPDIPPRRVGEFFNPLTEEEKKSSKNPAELVRGRGRRKIEKAFSEKKKLHLL